MNPQDDKRSADLFWKLMGVALFVNFVIPMTVPKWLTTGTSEGDILFLCTMPVIGGAYCLAKAKTRREKVLAWIAFVLGLLWLGLLVFGLIFGRSTP